MYQKILVAVDGSPTSMRGLDEAARLARTMSAQLRVVHVLEVTHHVSGFEPCDVFFDDALPAMERGGRAILERARVRAESHGVQAETRLISSFAARASELILQEAASWHADLIVIGTHGRRGFDRLLLGSDAEQMLRQSPVPVLLVRAAADAPVADEVKTSEAGVA